MFVIILKIIAIIAITRLLGGVIKIVLENLFSKVELMRYDNNPQRKAKIEEMRKRIEENLKRT